MIRILIFLLFIIFVAGTITYLSSLNGYIEAEAFNQKFSLHTGMVIGLVITVLGCVMYFTSLTKDIIALPQKIRNKRKEVRQERGMAALARGMESVVVGDAVDAQHHARIARRNLEQSSLTRLLTAQAAQMAGDNEAANKNFALMLEAPETEFLGLHGLYAQAQRSKDEEAARRYAERAFKLRPNARWAYESVMDISLERGAWGQTREVIRIAKDNRLIDEETARRGDAALLTADAYAAGLAGEHDTALQEAEAAIRLCPDLTPAAMLAASALADKGKKSRAVKILEQSFSARPHPAILKIYDDVYDQDTPEKRANAFRKLSKLSSDSHEGQFAEVRAEMLLGNYEEATTKLEGLTLAQPFARELLAMAEATGKLHGEEFARPLLERAATAPRNPEPGSDGAFNFTSSGWGRLVREYMASGRLAPPPLEDRPAVITREEIKLLAAPVVEKSENDESADNKEDQDENLNADDLREENDVASTNDNDKGILQTDNAASDEKDRVSPS